MKRLNYYKEPTKIVIRFARIRHLRHFCPSVLPSRHRICPSTDWIIFWTSCSLISSPRFSFPTILKKREKSFFFLYSLYFPIQTTQLCHCAHLNIRPLHKRIHLWWPIKILRKNKFPHFLSYNHQRIFFLIIPKTRKKFHYFLILYKLSSKY